MTENKLAVLAVSFGSSVAEAIKHDIAPLEAELAASIPNCNVFRAFTSRFIRKALKEKGASVPSVEEALGSIREAGFRRVLVVPTQIVAGSEYNKVVDTCEHFRFDFDDMKIAKPLLFDFADHRRALTAVSGEIPRLDGEALVLMGHGTSHPVDIAYAALNFEAIQMGYEDIYIGTVEGYPDIEQTLERVKRDGFSKVCLAPFMLVAGNHARKDMAGDHPESWKSLCANAGMDVRCVMQGLGRCQEIRALYAEHALRALEES